MNIEGIDDKERIDRIIYMVAEHGHELTPKLQDALADYIAFKGKPSMVFTNRKVEYDQS